MNRSLASVLLGFAAFAVACGGGAPNAGIPPATSATVRHHHGVRVVFSLKVPPRRHGRAHYVSPATRSVSVAIDGGAPTFFNVDASETYCSNLAGFLQCTIAVSATSGPHKFTIYTFDGANGTGAKLAAAVNFSYVIPATKGDVPIPITLGGIAAGVAILPGSAPQLFGTQYAGFTVFGKLPVLLTAVAVDADGNYILGPGAPAVTMTLPNGQPAKLASPPPYAPNSYALTSTYSPTDPSVPVVTTLTAVASPAPNTGKGPSVSATVKLTLYTPAIYAANYARNTVTAYDEQGNQKKFAGVPFAGLNGPSGVAYDLHNNEMYVTNHTSTPAIMSFSTIGTAIANSGSSPQSGDAFGIAYDPGLDVLDVAQPTSDVVGQYDPTSLTPDPQPSGAFVFDQPTALAYDVLHGYLYVSDAFGAGSIGAFNVYGQPVSLAGTFPNVDSPLSIAFDDHNTQIYVSDNASGAVTAYDFQGNQVSVAFPNRISPGGILYDPFDGLIYVGNTNGGISAYDENGNTVTTSGAFPNSRPYALTVVP